MAGKRDTKSDVSPSSVNWLTELAQELNVPYAPEGWYTVSQIGEVLGVDHQTVRRLLANRKAEMKIYKCLVKNGRTIRTQHYKL